MARALPPKVEPWSPGRMRSATSARAATAPMGKPSAMPLAMLTTSGSMPARWKLNGAPQRKKPVWTSSITSRMPFSWQRSETARR